jgi:hypothetical protein
MVQKPRLEALGAPHSIIGTALLDMHFPKQ